MRHFPASHRHCQYPTQLTENVKVHCKCRLQEDGEMIKCEGCGEWFHKQCEDIPVAAWTEENFKWFCCTCKIV